MFERLSPPWQDVETIALEGNVRPGDQRIIRLRAGPVGLKWAVIHGEYVEGRLFTDRQVRGPFAYWRHRHAFQDASSVACVVEDEVAFALPLRFVSHRLGISVAGRELRKLFRYRHFTTFHDMRELYAVRSYRRQQVTLHGGPPDIARQLAAFLRIAGHTVASPDEPVAPSGVVIELGGGYVAGVVARIHGATSQDSASGSQEVSVSSAMILSASKVRLLRLLRTRSSELDRELAWTTVDDFVVAVHRALLGLQDSNSVYVAHPVPISARELAGLLGIPVILAWLFPFKCGSGSRELAPRGEPAVADERGMGRIAGSRYVNAAEAIRIVTGTG